MDIKSEHEFRLTQGKLLLLRQIQDTTRGEWAGNSKLRDMSLRSLQPLINQLEEEIIRYQIRRSPAASAS